jgi:hypothetical protein
MNNLTELYKQIKSFADNHKMVNEFVFVASEDELQGREFNYRTLVLIPSTSNVSRDLNSPVYTLSFTVVLLDKVPLDNDLSSILSIEENIFVIGQLQDKMLKLGKDTSFEEIELISTSLEDYNITTAFCDFDIILSRKPFVMDINE